MKTNYILIDYENVQPDNLNLLSGHDLRLIVFVGANQKSVPVDLASALQPFGDKARYLKICGNGPDALDFHIAFYIGELSALDPNAFFHIIARDKGYDPLIEHLKERRIFARRHECITAIPFLRACNAGTLAERIEVVSSNLMTRSTSRPRKVDALRNTVNALFMKTLDDATQDAIIEDLVRRKLITITDQTVSYTPVITVSGSQSAAKQ